MEEPTKRQGSAKPANRSRLKSADRAPNSGGESGEKLDRRALIVGINDYQGGDERLPSCVNDARAIEDLVRGAYRFSSTRVSSTPTLRGQRSQRVGAALQQGDE